MLLWSMRNQDYPLGENSREELNLLRTVIATPDPSTDLVHWTWFPSLQFSACVLRISGAVSLN
jgi:hypothetical protein